MLKWLSGVFIVTSLFITVCHGVIAHHHEMEAAGKYHTDENEEGHNVFSYGELDEAFIHPNIHNDLTNDFVSPVIFEPLVSFELKLYSSVHHYPALWDYPPPDNLFYHSLSLRAPPAC